MTPHHVYRCVGCGTAHVGRYDLLCQACAGTCTTQLARMFMGIAPPRSHTTVVDCDCGGQCPDCDCSGTVEVFPATRE